MDNEIVDWITRIVTVATAVTAVLPTRAQNSPVIDVGLRILNVIAGNVFRNKNHDHND